LHACVCVSERALESGKEWTQIVRVQDGHLLLTVTTQNTFPTPAPIAKLEHKDRNREIVRGGKVPKVKLGASQTGNICVHSFLGRSIAI
jgi:hypothetical protein